MTENVPMFRHTLQCCIQVNVTVQIWSGLNFMRQSSWEAYRSSDSQEIFHILWNTTVHSRFHNSPPPVCFMQINPVHAPIMQILEDAL